MQKLFNILFENTLETKNDILDSIKVKIYPEKRFEIFFEYINSKNFQTNKDLLNFTNKSSCQEIYKDFDGIFKNIKDFFLMIF